MRKTIQLSPVNGGGYGESNAPISDVRLSEINDTASQAHTTNRGSSTTIGIIPRVNSFQVQMTLPDLSDWKSTIEDIAGAKIIQIINLSSETLITDILLDGSTSNESIMLQLNFASKINIDDIKSQIKSKWSKLNMVMHIL